MRICEKINLDRSGLQEHGPITIVALGDSVTHGAFRIGELDYEAVYWNLLKKKILAVRNYVPINVINAGIGGTNAKRSVERLEKQVLAHLPDLVTVCFGLNDVNNPLEDYLQSLKTIFEKCSASGAEVIFMTPNMLNTYVTEDTAQEHLAYAEKTARYQNEGRMDLYMEAAVRLAKEMQVEVCDCYAVWKEMSKTQDTTKLLANGINHPTREMHHLFADMLFEIIFRDAEKVSTAQESTMFQRENA